MLALMDSMVTHNVVNVIAILMELMDIIARQSMEHVLANTILPGIIANNVLADFFHILSVNLANVILLDPSTTIAMSRADNVNV